LSEGGDGVLSEAAEVVEDRSLTEGVENRAKLIRQQEVKYLMSIDFNIRMKISELLNMVAFSSIYSLILIQQSMINI
jgi:hypothetical protein